MGFCNNRPCRRIGSRGLIRPWDARFLVLAADPPSVAATLLVDDYFGRDEMNLPFVWIGGSHGFLANKFHRESRSFRVRHLGHRRFRGGGREPSEKSRVLVIRVVGRDGASAVVVVVSFPAFPYAENRRIVLIEQVGTSGDPGVESSVFLQFPDGKGQRQAGIASRHVHVR